LWEEADRSEALRVLIEDKTDVVVWAAIDDWRELCCVSSPPDAPKRAALELAEAEERLARLLAVRWRYILTDDNGAELFSTPDEERAVSRLMLAGRIDVVAVEPKGGILARRVVSLPLAEGRTVTRDAAGELLYEAWSETLRAVREQIIPLEQRIAPEDLERCD
jgi:hypothetical protein